MEREAELTRIGVGDSRKSSKRNMASLVTALESGDLFGVAAILQESRSCRLSGKDFDNFEQDRTMNEWKDW